MAKVKLNPIIEEVHGQLGDLVFREVNGQTILSRKSSMSGVETSEDQAAQRVRFGEAVAYGKTVMADSDVRELYEQAAKAKDTPLFALTVADFLNPPTIKDVDLSAYNGQVNDVIKVKASDDFGVVKVRVAITDAQSSDAVESGDAFETATGSGLWLYSVTTAVTTGPSVNITVVATDRPGGTAVDTQTKFL